MTAAVINRFSELFKLRCDNYPLLNFGEDSVRYDFFCSVSEVLKLEPWQIQLEYAMNKSAYITRNNENSKRKEKPMLDLIVNHNGTNMCVEFGLFRQNSNTEGNINQTEKTKKMVNDMIRLGLESYYSKREAYFVCVADEKMLGHQLRSEVLEIFPSSYLIDVDDIENMMNLKSSGFDERFVNKFRELKFKLKADLITNKEVKAKKITLQTKILIWKVSLLNN